MLDPFTKSLINNLLMDAQKMVFEITETAKAYRQVAEAQKKEINRRLHYPR